MKKIALVIITSLLLIFNLYAQQPDKIYMPDIHTVKLFITGNQDAYPIIKLNATNQCTGIAF